MIFYRNYHRKLANKQEEIEAIRQCNGKDDNEGGQFELVELVLKKTCVSPEKRHGFQDTDITHEQDGSVAISHRVAGSGMLRFEPNNYGNPMGFLAKTKHNLDMLAKSYFNKEWTYMSKSIEDEVRKAFDKHWKSMPEKDRKMAELMKEQAIQDRFSVASDPTPPPTRADGTNLVLQQLAELRAENERLRAEIKPPKIEPIAGVTPPETPVQEVPIAAPNIAMNEAEDEYVHKSAWTITAKDGTVYDFEKIPNFEVRRIAKKYGINYDKSITKEQLIGVTMDAIEKELYATPAPVAAPVETTA